MLFEVHQLNKKQQQNLLKLSQKKKISIPERNQVFAFSFIETKNVLERFVRLRSQFSYRMQAYFQLDR